MTTRTHGTRSCYVAGCRLPQCRAANTAAQARYTRLRAQRTWGAAPPAYVDAGPVRTHVQHLTRAGMGWRRVAEKAGVADGCVSRLLFGSAGRPPSARVRPATAKKLLAVRVDLADAAAVDATGTHRRIQALIAAGWSASQIGVRLGITPTNMHGLLARDRVLARTARAVRAVYDQMWDSPPPEDTWHTKAAATRARRYAADRGWVRAAAWDDDTIDDPNTHPHANDTADGVDVDELLVHNALAGRSVQLNRDERDEVARRILARGGSVADIARILRLDHTQAKRIVQRLQRNDAGHCDAPVAAVAQ